MTHRHGRSAYVSVLSLIFFLATWILTAAPKAQAQVGGAVMDLPGCTDHTLAGGSETGALPFTLSFAGQDWSEIYVNESGSVSFGGPVPFGNLYSQGLPSVGIPVIAPLYIEPGASTVTWGTSTLNGKNVFCVNWSNFQSPDDPALINNFQLLLVDSGVKAPAPALGDKFDVIFNYDRVDWATDSNDGPRARAGYSEGNLFSAVEITGSGDPAAMVNPTTGLVAASLNSTQAGRYILTPQNIPTYTISGIVTANANAVANANVQVCSQILSSCYLTRTDLNGRYLVPGVVDGTYDITAFPVTTDYFETTVTAVVVSGAPITRDIALTAPRPIPAGVTFNPLRNPQPGILPTFNWHSAMTLTVSGCSQGTATYELKYRVTNGLVIASGSLTEVSSGNYQGSIPPVYPAHGASVMSINLRCPNPTQDQQLAFDTYIDPSGTVVNARTGEPISGAHATLLRSDTNYLPFEVVPDGSPTMSPENRHNPSVTGADGFFGWDVMTGFYRVRAEAPGCRSTTDPQVPYAETPTLPVPPEWTGLVLELDCESVATFKKFSANLAITLGRKGKPDAFVLSSTFTSAGINLVNQAVSVQFGDFATTIPAGSFKKDRLGIFTYKGVIEDVNLAAQLVPLGGTRYLLLTEGKGANLDATVNPVPVTLTVGSESGSTSVKALIIGRR